MYILQNFLTGIGIWITFIIFIGGLIIRSAYLYGLSQEKDKVFYNHFNWSWALLSIIHWLIPLGSKSFRQQPIFASISFIFHTCLLIIPTFLLAHNYLWKETFVWWNLASLPEYVSDSLTLLFICCIIFLFLRRLIRPEVRSISTKWEYIQLFLIASPFVTGYLAYHQIGPYQYILTLHIISSQIMLITIPYTKLSHIIFFFFTRAFIGCEMGARREVDPRLGPKIW